MQTTEGHWTITLETMLHMVNDKRRQRDLAPIDHATMTTRLVLRSQVACPGVFDFRAAELLLDSETMAVLEELLNEQFDVSLRSELKRRCTFHPAADMTLKPKRPQLDAKDESDDENLLAYAMRLFGLGKRKRAD